MQIFHVYIVENEEKEVEMFYGGGMTVQAAKKLAERHAGASLRWLRESPVQWRERWRRYTIRQKEIV